MTCDKPILLTLVLTLLPWPVCAGFEEALQNYMDGDRVGAFQGFREAAEAGDTRAFGKLGGMYLYGAGTGRDYAQAYIWFGLAGMSDDQYAVRFQNAASSQLKPEDIPRLQAVIDAEASLLGLMEPEHPASPNEIPGLRDTSEKKGGVFGTEPPLQEGENLPALDFQ